jgi:hypothetical protein
MSEPSPDEDPVKALLQADVDEFLKSPAVAQKVIERVSAETRLPALLVRVAYYWLLVPVVRSLQDGIQDHAIEGIIHRITMTFDGFLGNQLTAKLLPKLAEHMKRENADKAANKNILQHYPAVPNASLLSPDALTQAILTLQLERDESFQRDVKSQLLTLQQLVERQPALDLTLAPSAGNKDPFRFAFGARKATLVGRSNELTELQEFTGGFESFRWWSIGGEAGVGKSRLLLEAMLNLGPPWRVGFLPRSFDKGFSWHDWRPLYPTFIAIDDAGLRVPEIASMIQAINMSKSEGKLAWAVRIVLLDRAADVLRLPGWEEASLVAHVRPTQFKEAKIIRGLNDVDALAVASQLAGPESGNAALELLQRIDGESRPLFVSLAADAVLSGTDQGLGSIAGLAADFWKRTKEAFWAPLGAGEAEFDVLCLATLVAGLPLQVLADAAWADLGLPRASLEIKQRLVLMQTIEDTNRRPRIRALQPTFAGEVFVLDHFNQSVGIGKNPSTGILRAAWRHSPFEVSAFVQRAVSDLPDHPALQMILESGPEIGDDQAREVWSSCLRACVGTQMAAGKTELALRTFALLLRLAEGSPTDHTLTDAAFIAAELITYLGLPEITGVIKLLEDLVKAFNRRGKVAAPFGAMPPVTEHRRQMLALKSRMDPVFAEIFGTRLTWPGAFGAAFQATVSLGERLPSLQQRLALLAYLEKRIQPVIDAAPTSDDPGTFLLRSQLMFIQGSHEICRTSLDGNKYSVLIHKEQSLQALEQGEMGICVAEAKAALHLAMSVELIGEFPVEIWWWSVCLAVDLNRKDYFIEARTLLAAAFDGEEAVSSREAIVDWLGGAAEPELVDQLYLVATQKPVQ